MSGTHASPPLAGYRDTVRELMQAGQSFGEIEDIIDELADLTTDQKAALWLFAFSLRDQLEQPLAAQAYLSVIE
jgi:hypothetical protein